MDVIEIHYLFKFENNQSEQFSLQLDANTLEMRNPALTPAPAWTQLDYHQCSHCPLKREAQPQCPLALRLAEVVARFDYIFSHDKLELTVKTAERTLVQTTTAQRALSSLLGLIMATSGCPHTALFKPMARFHLPLASELETEYRVAGMFLLAQYFRRRRGQSAELALDGLHDIYQNLHLLNRAIAKRIRDACQSDSSINAVVLLDMLTKQLPQALNTHLAELEQLFAAYD